MTTGCEGCPLVEWKQCSIAESERHIQELVEFIGGVMQLAHELRGTERIKAVLEVAQGIESAIAARAKTGREHLVPGLAEQEELANTYFKATDSQFKLMDHDERILNRAQATCHGPESRKEHGFYGARVLLCTGKGGLMYKNLYLEHQKARTTQNGTASSA